jgi:hypothetical protein
MTGVPGWESLRASEAIARLPTLSYDQLKWVEERESSPKGRVTVARAARRALSRLRAGSPTPLARAQVDPRVTKDLPQVTRRAIKDR